MFEIDKKDIDDFTNDENFNRLMKLYIETYYEDSKELGDYVDAEQIIPVLLYRTFKSQEILNNVTIVLVVLTATLVILTIVLIYLTLQI